MLRFRLRCKRIARGPARRLNRPVEHAASVLTNPRATQPRRVLSLLLPSPPVLQGEGPGVRGCSLLRFPSQSRVVTPPPNSFIPAAARGVALFHGSERR